MDISVALCTYNGEAYLQHQLESIAGQNRKPDEMVVCDDQSSDRTVEILERFASEAAFPVQVHVNEKNLGSTKNFEKAIKLCSGDVIALADQDDVWHPDKLRFMEEAFYRSPDVGLVFADAEVVDEHLSPLGYSLWQAIRFTPGERRRIAAGRSTEVLLRHNVVTGAVMSFRSSFRHCVLPIPSDCIHDAWIAFLISAFADLVAIEKPLIKYRQHSGNQIGAKKQKFSRRVAQALVSNPSNSFIKRSQLYRTAQERLQTAPWKLRDDRTLQLLEAATLHFLTRAEIVDSERFSRVPLILREAFSFRYFRYSNGFQSVIKDLLF